MKKNILICPKCNNYTLKKTCSNCKTKTISPKPAKYSPEDRFGKYRREYKKNVQNKETK
ncbi:MAG: RNA-protein complex protein Nop10 [Nanoarchaeota archaeon]|nr:RNA-protein complex protein Nop10 [Nanoarchaeota archaeon]